MSHDDDTDHTVIDGPWRARPSTFVCPHETPGGPQRCALCRRAVERQHDGWDQHHEEPHWKRLGKIVERQAVPMPDHVRREWEKLRRAPAPRQVQDGLL